MKRETAANVIFSAWVATLVALIALLSYAHGAEPAAAHKLEWAGTPEGTVLRQGKYLLAFDGARRLPRWTLELLDAETIGTPSERPTSFYTDKRVPREFRPALADYGLLSEMDKGHCAASSNYGDAAAKLATFTALNIAPQHAQLNRGPWKDLEAGLQAEARQGARLYVITCPLELAGGRPAVTYRIAGDSRLAVPTHWGKAVLEVDGNWHPLRARAWLFPNRAPATHETIAAQQISVDQLEHEAGLDCFSGLAIDVQERLEAERPR